MPYTNFIYDFDGTLSDSYPIFTKSFLQVLEHHGFSDTYAHVLSLLKRTVRTAIESYPFTASYKEVSEEYRALREAMMLTEAKPVEGARELLAYVAKHGGRNYLYTHSGGFVLQLVEKWGMAPYFTDVITADHGFPSKPAPDALNYLLQKHCMDKSQTLMIGDRDIDLEAGHGAGIKGILLELDDYYKHYACELRVPRLLDIKRFLA